MENSSDGTLKNFASRLNNKVKFERQFFASQFKEIADKLNLGTTRSLPNELPIEFNVFKQDATKDKKPLESTKKANRIIIVPDQFKTIQEAVNQSIDGDTVFVRAGNYSESVYINKDIKLQGTDKDNTFISVAEGNAFGIFVDHAKVTISNFTVRGFGTDTEYNVWGAGWDTEIKDNKTLIKNVLSGGPADRAGVLPGMEIIKVNNVVMENYIGEEVYHTARGQGANKVVYDLRLNGVDKKVFLTPEYVNIKGKFPDGIVMIGAKKGTDLSHLKIYSLLGDGIVTHSRDRTNSWTANNISIYRNASIGLNNHTNLELTDSLIAENKSSGFSDASYSSSSADVIRFKNVKIFKNGRNGIYLSNVELTGETLNINNNTKYGLLAFDSSIKVKSSYFTQNLETGFVTEDSNVTLENVEASNNKKNGYGVTTFRDGTKEEGKYKNNVLVTDRRKPSKLFLLRSSKFRDKIDIALNNAMKGGTNAQQKAEIAMAR
jgi:hypothetical protein